MDKTPPRALPEIQREAVATLRRLSEVAEGERPEILRTMAGLFVASRAHFLTADGSPDWRGRSAAYRGWVQEVLSDANVASESRTNLLAAIRYHVGFALREQLDADTLDDLGFLPTSPLERSQAKRDRYSETIRLFGHGGGPIDDAVTILAAVKMIDGALSRVRLGGLRAADRRRAAEALDAVAEHARQIAVAARPLRRR